MISVLPCELNEDDTFEGTESGEISMDTLEMVNYEQCSSCVMEMETAITSPVREVETGTNPACGTEITENLHDSLVEAKMEIPAAETDIDMDAAEVEQINHLYKGIKYQSIAVVSVSESKELKKLDHCLQKYKDLLAERSPLAKLW
ncbi:Hypothetical predicted protein [Paramuricea clavata]|uniref:Uncharacterized protein n=1 Tax=Paramuricea clavata TaxID=317549 RepID=A0A7D9L9I2_PARCT|nr:Hypothetical predicted protein [Paramuricea clavata]